MNLEKKRILKWCDKDSRGYLVKGEWLRTDVRFLRGGDRFKVDDEDGVFMATDNPYFRKPAEKPPMNIKKILAGEEVDNKVDEPCWTVNFIRER